ncbi:MAG: hypothetical protein AAF773_00190 [Cyanobacteria bacterium P01_D01_bin.115]
MTTGEHRFICFDSLYAAADFWWEVCEQRPDYEVTIFFPSPSGNRCISTTRHRERWELQERQAGRLPTALGGAA